MYLFFQWESQDYFRHGYKEWDNFFNASLTWNENSEFYNPFGSVAGSKMELYRRELERQFPNVKDQSKFFEGLGQKELDKFFQTNHEKLFRNLDKGKCQKGVYFNCWFFFFGYISVQNKD